MASNFKKRLSRVIDKIDKCLANQKIDMGKCIHSWHDTARHAVTGLEKNVIMSLRKSALHDKNFEVICTDYLEIRNIIEKQYGNNIDKFTIIESIYMYYDVIVYTLNNKITYIRIRTPRTLVLLKAKDLDNE